MIRLSFDFPEPGSPWHRTWQLSQDQDPASITEMDLRYKYFGASVEMIIDDIEVISSGRFVTVVDLALSISHVVQRISSGENAAFGFTESDEVVRLEIDGDQIAVSSSKKPWKAVAGTGEVVDAFCEFLREVHSRLIQEVPGLIPNPTVRRIR